MAGYKKAICFQTSQEVGLIVMMYPYLPSQSVSLGWGMTWLMIGQAVVACDTVRQRELYFSNLPAIGEIG